MTKKKDSFLEEQQKIYHKYIKGMPKKKTKKVPCLVVELGKHRRNNGKIENNSISYNKEKVLNSLINMNSLLDWLEENQDKFEAETILSISQKLKLLADQVEREEVIFEKFIPLFEKIIMEEEDKDLRAQRLEMALEHFLS